MAATGIVDGSLDDVSFTLDITTTMLPRVFPPPFGGRIEHADAEMVDVKVKDLVMTPDTVVYVGSTIEIVMFSPVNDYIGWELVHDMTKMMIPDTFTYDEAEGTFFKKTFECPNGHLTCSEMVEVIIDFERNSGHRGHKSWFGGIDCKWVNFEGLCKVSDGAYCIVYGS